MTIPLAVVAGIPLAPYRQARIRPVREGWEVRVIPGNQRRRADLRGVWAHVLKVVDQARADGVHLILSHDRENERRKFLELKSRSYRAVWLPRTLSADYRQPAFNTAIDWRLGRTRSSPSGYLPDFISMSSIAGVVALVFPISIGYLIRSISIRTLIRTGLFAAAISYGSR